MPIARYCCAAWVAFAALLAALAYPVLHPLYFRPFHTPFHLIGRDGVTHTFCNFDRNMCCNGSLYRPTSVSAVADIVRDAAKAKRKVRVVGAGHSMSRLVCDATLNGAAGLDLLSLDHLERIVRVDAEHMVVDVEAGIRLKTLNERLWARGLALHNMGLIDEQSVAGLTATGVHGTGINLQSVSNVVDSMDIVDSSGNIRVLSNASHRDTFRYARLHLGLFGVVVRLRLRVRPAYELIREHAYVSVDTALATMEREMRAGRNFQMWWVTHTDLVLLNRIDVATDAQRDDPALRLTPFRQRLDKVLTDVAFLGMCALVHYMPTITPTLFQIFPYVMPARTFVAPNHVVLTHPGINYHTVKYTETEYFVPLRNAVDAVRAVHDFTLSHTVHCPVNAIHPLRSVKADDIPHSPVSSDAANDVFVAVSFVMVDPPDWELCMRAVEALLRPLDGRPHWGKRHSLNRGTVEKMYGADAVDGLKRAARDVDPAGVFRTRELERLFF